MSGISCHDGEKEWKVHPLSFLGSACIGAILRLVNYVMALDKGRRWHRAALPLSVPSSRNHFLRRYFGSPYFYRVTVVKADTLPVIVLLTSALIATQSRGAFVAFIAGLIVFLLLGIKIQAHIDHKFSNTGRRDMLVGSFSEPIRQLLAVCRDLESFGKQ